MNLVNLPFHKIYGSVIGLLLVAQIGTTTMLKMKQGEVEKKNAEITSLELVVAGYEAQTNLLEQFKQQGDEIAARAANTCRRVIEFKVQHTIEAAEIQNAETADDAIAAYDRLLCERPEAAGHPKCAARAAEDPS